MTDTTKKIIEQILAVPRGKVCSYRDIAAKAGLPRRRFLKMGKWIWGNTVSIYDMVNIVIIYFINYFLFYFIY